MDATPLYLLVALLGLALGGLGCGTPPAAPPPVAQPPPAASPRPSGEAAAPKSEPRLCPMPPPTAAPRAPIEPCLEADIASCERRCDGGDIDACVAFAERLQRQDDGDRRLVELDRRTCEAGVLQGCFAFASLRERAYEYHGFGRAGSGQLRDRACAE